METKVITESQVDKPAPRSWWRRLGWLLLIWLLSVLALGMVAGLMRAFMMALGLEVA